MPRAICIHHSPGHVLAMSGRTAALHRPTPGHGPFMQALHLRAHSHQNLTQLPAEPSGLLLLVCTARHLSLPTPQPPHLTPQTPPLCRVLYVPTVAPHERFLLQHLGLPGFYHVVARYGYMDTIQQGPEHAHKIKEHVLVMLYLALQGALDRNTLAVEQLKLDYKPGGCLAGSLLSNSRGSHA